jgi:hypothetical protein
MRQTISGLIAAIAIMAASAAPAMACGDGLFLPCQGYVPVPVYWGCNAGCGGWAYERLPDPEQQYYYADQGPTYTGPGNFAPYPVYREGMVSGWDGYRYGYRRMYRHSLGYGYHGVPLHYGYRAHTRRYY